VVRETASLLAAYVSFALLHGANPRRLPRGVRPNAAMARAWGTGFRATAVFFFVLSAWLWNGMKSGPEGVLVALLATIAAGTFFVLCAPIFPRAAWGVALIGPPLLAALAFLGGGDGP
jgi:hypothetical protein